MFSAVPLRFCTCIRLPLLRTGALLRSQHGADGEEEASSAPSHVLGFSCHSVITSRVKS